MATSKKQGNKATITDRSVKNIKQERSGYANRYKSRVRDQTDEVDQNWKSMDNDDKDYEVERIHGPNFGM